MAIVDLSVLINEATPVYPGDPATKIQPAGNIKKDGYLDHYVSIGTHVGTHVDAPAHMIEGGKTLNYIPIDKFCGRGVMIHIDKEFDLDTVQKTDIREGDIILFHTGMSKVYHSPEYFDSYPAITEAVAKYLIQKKVNMVGVDMCSVDHEPFPVHKLLLSNDILIIENLVGLEGLRGKSFKVYAFPINLEIDGGAARVIAEINEGDMSAK